MWSVEEYLSLPTNHLVEFSDGYLEVLPMPTQIHQFIVLFLYRALLAYVESIALGVVLVAPIPVRVHGTKYREPDIVLMLAEHADRRHEQFWEKPDLVMEVVSPDDPDRDWETKRREYAQAGIPEYWIVDPEQEHISVLRLAGDAYIIHGEFGRGTKAQSALLPGFEILTDDVWEAGRQ